MKSKIYYEIRVYNEVLGFCYTSEVAEYLLNRIYHEKEHPCYKDVKCYIHLDGRESDCVFVNVLPEIEWRWKTLKESITGLV